MTAAVQARSLTITVNGNDWSQNLVSFEIGFESYAQGTGLILKTGTLVLCNIYGDSRAIDPIEQDDFEVGNTVSVKLPDNVAHPLGNSLKILAPPEVSPINSGIPEIEGNLIVSIPVGCNLAYSKTEESDDDKTGVTLGSYLDTYRVIGNLLNASGIPDSGIDFTSLPGGGFNGVVNFPYSKNGGGFVDLAGEFTYAGNTWKDGIDLISQPIYSSCLYCNQSNIVKSKRVFSPKSANTGDQRSHDYTRIVITVGTNDRLYQRQLDLSIAPGKVEIDGIKRKVKDLTEDYPFTDVITNSDGSRAETTFYYAESKDIPSGLGLFSFAPSAGSTIESVPVPQPWTGTKYTYQGQTIVTTQTTSGNFGLTTTTVTGREYQLSFYNIDKFLDYEITVRYVKAGSLYPSGWENIENPIIYTAAINYQDTIVRSEIVVTTFGFTGSQVTSKRVRVYSNLFLIDRNADFNTEFQWAFNQAPIPGIFTFSLPLQNMVVKQDKTEEWKQVGERWIYTVKDFSPAIVNNPTNFDDPRSVKLALSPKPVIPFTTTVNAKDTQPPAIVNWGGKFNVTEIQLTGSAVFGTGTNAKLYRLQSPFWFTGPSSFVTDISGTKPIDISEDSPQPDLFAKIEGEIINGRQFQYLIECDPSLFESITSPLPGVTVVEPTKKRYFLADALTWYHTATETYVAFAGIFAGSSGTEGTTPTIYPAQLVTAPVPSATITVDGFTLIDTISGSADPDE